MKIQKISVVIPIYNEAKNLPELITRLKKALLKTNKKYELLFIDDHSTDDTDKIFQKLKSEQNLTLLKKKGQKGKAYSIMEGFAAVRGDAVAMIDADLQYPPEAIPGMVEALENADIVVANRKHYQDSYLRKVLSRTFRMVFGRLLFGLNNDIQSGLKIFSRDVIQTINFAPSSAWTFDLEMLHTAHHAGYVIKNFDIDFARRKNGHSNINILKTAFEIGFNSLKLRARRIHPVTVKPQSSGNMLGAGVRYKKRLYVTHTTLPHHVSALRTFTFLQKSIITLFLISIIVGLVLKPLFTLQALVALLSLIYFIDVFFNLFLILKSLSFPQEIVSTEEELAQINDKDLPIYTILCPLYRETHVIPQFMNAIKKLSYPREKLDVILLLEEDDKESIASLEKMRLPAFVRTIVVPHSIPKTKPKACNYGLAFARGEYLVIFDAEDIPEPMQLKKAFLGFQKVSANTICLQAKLNYYNPHQNLLTRFFTAEYSLWFDVTLTGLQSINTTIPLGGTSNHFKIESLRKVEGWDPFNVTEDADLGMRLFKRGYKTAMIDSVTLEEANSKLGNWLRQRSRWIKGYMQTYLVHVRETLSFTKEQGIHSLIFQLVIGGKIAFILINPLLWLATIAYFTLYAFVGPQIEALYPSVVFYMAVVSLIFGNFLFLYYYMIGVAKKEQWTLMKFVFLIPIYWLMISAAAFIALYQLIFKPHYWEKTVHGFHLAPSKKVPAVATVAAIAPEKVIYVAPFRWRALLEKITSRIAFAQSKIIKSGVKLSLSIKTAANTLLDKKNLYLSGVLLISATMTSNVLNLIFNIYLGRALSLEEFGEISLFTSLLYLVSIPLGSFSSTISHNIAYLYGKQSKEHAQGYLKYIFRKSIVFGIILSTLWLLLTPFLSKFFQTESLVPIILFSPIWFISVASSNFSGFFAGTLSFGKKGLILLTESVARLILAILLVSVGFSNIVFLAIVASLSISVIVGWLLAKGDKAKEVSVADRKFNFTFFLTSNLNGISLITFLTLDVILVKHFLTPTAAGQYGLLSLIGKMTYFLGSLFVPFVIPVISHHEGAKKNSQHVFLFLFATTFAFCVVSFVGLGLLGRYIVPLIFGAKTQAIIPLLAPYVLAMAIFTISQPIVSYFQAKENYSFTIVGFLVAIIQIGLTYLFHKNLEQIVFVMLTTSTINLVLMAPLYVFQKEVKIITSNIKDFYGLFKTIKKPYVRGDKLRILILNWRDTKHKWTGGAEVYVHELAKLWVKDGNSVTLFCGNDGHEPRNEVIDGIQIYRRGGFYTVYVWALLYYLFRFRGKYDVIIDSENGIPFFTPLYANIHKFLLIHHVHQEVFRQSLRRPFSTIALFLEARLMPLVYRNVQVITVSPSSKEEILRNRLTKKEPLIIYNGVDTLKFKPGIKSEKPLVLYLGRLQRYKSLDIFIKAAQEILKKIPEAEFVIAGEGGEKNHLIKLAEKMGILEKIKFTGKVTEEEKIKLFQKAWVFMNPSLMEGWGITTIEANACGTPTIASNVPGLRDSVSNLKTGILVEYGNYEIFAQDAIILLQDNALRKEMSLNSIERAKKYSWEQSALVFYETLSNHLERNPIVRSNGLAYVLNRFLSLL